MRLLFVFLFRKEDAKFFDKLIFGSSNVTVSTTTICWLFFKGDWYGRKKGQRH
jgi:hypothetical protein